MTRSVFSLRLLSFTEDELRLVIKATAHKNAKARKRALIMFKVITAKNQKLVLPKLPQDFNIAQGSIQPNTSGPKSVIDSNTPLLAE